MPRRWVAGLTTVRAAWSVLALIAPGLLSCSQGLRTSPARDAGSDGARDAVSDPDDRGRDVGVAGDAVDAVDAGSPTEVSGPGPCMTPFNCGTQTLATDRRPPDVLIVVDRSDSMRRSLTADCRCAASPGDDPASLCADPTNCADRFTTVKSALAKVVGDNPDVQWGLAVFPSLTDGSCAVPATPLVPIAADAGAQVVANLASTSPGGSTPLAPAIDNAVGYLQALADGNSKAIVLATDGVPECPEGQPRPDTGVMADALAANAAALRAGIPVYVLGAGPATAALDDLANAGGTRTHYPANSPQDFSDSLASVSRLVMSCTISLASPPPDPSNVVVYMDKQLVPKAPDNGWTFGATNTAIVLTGSYCDHLVASWTTTVEVLFGCPGSPPPCFIP
jgi:Mg-chelatase subunit ChlD